jgi:AcrR family transcriptional regulator
VDLKQHGSQDLKQHGSLRERKKARTRASIREHALRLFRERGYQATTVEQIAAAAEVSPSTFFRYFPTKEDVVLQDDMDTRMIDALARQPADLSPVAAIRAATKEALASFSPDEMALVREAADLSLTVPEIRARAIDEFARAIDAMAEVIGERVGRPPRDLAVRTLVGAVIGVVMSVTMPWRDWADEASGKDMPDRIDEALSLLQAGLSL